MPLALLTASDRAAVDEVRAVEEWIVLGQSVGKFADDHTEGGGMGDNALQIAERRRHIAHHRPWIHEP